MTSPKEIKLHKYQTTAAKSLTPITVCSSGIQGGKTIYGALDMVLSINEHRNPLDTFLICAPTYKILNQATLPAFFALSKGMGEYKKVDQEFKVHGGGTIYIRTATDPNSIEGITRLRKLWLDEGGMVSRYFWENCMGRAAFMSAKITVTTTPYALNWLATLVDDVKKKKRDDSTVVQWKSIDNPYFPKSEYDRQKKLLDPRRFAMKYMGEFGKMEGLVYEDVKTCMSQALPRGTKYYAGVDWGYTDPFVIVIRAVTPDGLHYRVSEFFKTGLTISQCIDALRARDQIYDFEMVVCDPSQPAHIQEINEYGLSALGGDNDIRMGIDKHVALIRSNRFFVFEDMCSMGLDEYSTYHYPEPKELMVDDDSKEQLPVDANNHGLDADRYLTMYLSDNEGERRTPFVSGQPRTFKSQGDRVKWLKRKRRHGTM